MDSIMIRPSRPGNSLWGCKLMWMCCALSKGTRALVIDRLRTEAHGACGAVGFEIDYARHSGAPHR